MPLPPYIERKEDDPRMESDNERYQTVYADYGKQVAVAAPTAGLHFHTGLIATLEAKGATFRDLTLQVGIELSIQYEQRTSKTTISIANGMRFQQPHGRVCSKQGPDHESQSARLRCARQEDAITRFRKNRVASSPSGSVQAEADIYIYPPYSYACVDHMITNFHLRNQRYSSFRPS